ncbi:helix-turn-helix domain-containing protein [Rhizobium rhizophilum]|uniref:Helix-turn-helix transcriptional regulator n=1 Tax=Rhizobium rhizophilum TaxID=1850373 RepID=A0ABY2R0V6_9HYPH|nr:XRE family transcriptional regulator [Rhizobium rhizophilum]THV16486.1 helix-turn-helix transcriptional regulator [Rhizobium rhizophilum]
MSETARRIESYDESRQARAIAERIRAERDIRSWSLAELSARSGVSKAMISKVERCEASPTASVLGRLSGAFGLPLSVLLAMAEREGDRLARRSDQPVWVDPETGYSRRTLSPPNSGQLELIEVVLPAGVRVPYPASAFSFQHQQIHVLEGELDFVEGPRSHQLSAGDCLQLGAPEDCVFVNGSDRATRYLVALTRRG